MSQDCDVAVVGAGPAGLVAASLCARAGLATLVFDRAREPGGRVLGEEPWNREALVGEFAASGAPFAAGTAVVGITPDLSLTVSNDQGSATVEARSVIVATGALERSGAELSGSVTLASAYQRFRASGELPRGRTVIAGSGALLAPTALALARAGANVVALLETTPARRRRLAWRHAGALLLSPRTLEWIGTRASIARAVRTVRRVDEGSLPDAVASLGADTVLVHEGLVPDVALARAAGVRQRWDRQCGCWMPFTDANGGTNMAGILVAGAAREPMPARAAQWSGLIAAIAVIRAIDPARKLPVEKLARTALAQQRRGRDFFEAWDGPPEKFLTAAGPSEPLEGAGRSVIEPAAQGQASLDTDARAATRNPR